MDAENRIDSYQPYTKQKAFHAAGAIYRERLLRAGNQLGKTFCGAAEMAYHLTGEYPDWWQGRRWDKPIKAWVGGKDSISLRDSVGDLLLGPPTARGTGSIRKRRIVDIAPARGVADGVDNVTIRHTSGGTSRLTFKSYDQGRERWQAATLDLVWFDEEPPEDIYSEGLTRTNATGGMAYMTFTPLMGMSSVVKRFLQEHSSDRHDTNMTIEDALHIPEDERATIIAQYPAHEREARTKGIPMLGSGRVFPVAQDDISIEAKKLPEYWPRLGALDFGWDHPSAAVELVFDPDEDVIYVTKAHRAKQQTPLTFAAAVKPWGDWLPWAWPHDGLNETSAGGGISLKTQYESHGLKMLGTRAQFADGSTSVEAGIMEMLDRMQTGRLKVFSHLSDWFEEFLLYHRKDGKIVKVGEDLLSATRYGVMMIRHAVLPPRWRSSERQRRAAQPADPLSGF